MKIAIVRKAYTFHGGAENFSQALVERLAEQNHDIHIFAVTWKSTADTPGLSFHRVPTLRFNSFLRDLTFAVSSYFMLKGRRNDFDIIQAHDKTLYQDIYRAGDGCHREWLRQRWVRTGILGRFSIALNPYHWLILGIERTIFKRHLFEKVVAISDLVKRNIIAHYRVDARDIEVVYNGVDLERFHPRNAGFFRNEIREKHHIGEEEFVVLFVGSGFERKGLRYLLRAVEDMAEPVTVLVVGKGSQQRHSMTATHGKVVFCGPQKDIHKYYAAADAFVLPTIYEPFGNVHLEALASGLPCITTRLSGAAEIIQDGVQGFTVEKPEDVELLGQKIRQVMNPENRSRMGVEARSLAETFSFANHLDRMKNVYDAVLRSRP